jgi:hypothetical protein
MQDYWASPASLSQRRLNKQQIKDKLASPSIDREAPMRLYRRDRAAAASATTTTTAAAAASNTYTLLASSPDLDFYMLSDNKTLVMYLNTMAPTDYIGTFRVCATERCTLCLVGG